MANEMHGSPRPSASPMDLINIHCRACGAPAAYDIVRHTYTCAYCGSDTGVQQGLTEKKGFRKMKQKGLREQKEQFRAVSMTCTGCGATVVLPENEVLSSCSFCGRALARADFLKTPDFPELIIPFRLTKEEAKERFAEWCGKNAAKQEAKRLKACLNEIQGYYLPYELIRGPVNCSVSRDGTSRKYSCGGFLNGIFVNASSQLDNLMLDGMEPFDVNEIREFEFAYLAQQKAKIKDISQEQLDKRVQVEVSADYTPVVAKSMETKGVSIQPNTEELLRMPVMLPVYYIHKGKVCAAVNGQTGKVAVRCEKTRKTLPWWIRPIALTVATFLAVFFAIWFFTRNVSVGVYGSGAFTLVMGLIYYTAFSNAFEGTPVTELPPKIFTSQGQYIRGSDGVLHASDQKITADPVKPVFFETVKGQRTAVHIRFTTLGRFIKQMALCFGMLFLPIIIAFILNGFHYHGLHPSGAAVWLCIFVPVVPAYYIKMGRIDIYENPYIYTIDNRGHKHKVKTKSGTTTVMDVVKILFTTPIIWAGLFLVFVLLMDIYLVLGG